MQHHLHLIDTLKGNEYHGARYDARRSGWAEGDVRPSYTY